MSETSRERRWRRERRILRLLTATVVLSAGLYAWRSLIPTFTGLVNRVAIAHRKSPGGQMAGARRSRPIYPYSIIRGGAYSGAELRDALDRDPVAARHYFGFRRSLVHPAVSPFSEPVFLSYRVGNAVYWTSRPVRLPAGETLLTDGENYARARCGNRVSPTPQTPVNDTEPAPKTLEIPEAPPVSTVDLETWSENRLLSVETPLILPSSLAMPVSAVPSTIAEIQSPPSWWVATPPSGFLSLPIFASIPRTPIPPPSTPVIQPNPIPLLPAPPVPTISGSPIPVIPPEGSPPLETWPPSPTVPTIPGPPIVPTVPPELVPEPSLFAPLIVVLAGLAAARIRRKP